MTPARLVRAIDENRSLWMEGKAPYEPLPALDRDVRADVAVIGGGFTGVSTALHLARRFPERRVVLLEARALANGASGRNGGLMLNGINVHVREPEEARRIYEVTSSGIDLILDTIREHGLDVGHRRDGCLDVFTDTRRADKAAAEIERLRAAGLPLEFLSGAALRARVRLEGAVGAVLDPRAGQLDGVDLLRGLRPVLLSLGVAVHEQTPVLSLEEGRELRLVTPGGEVRAAAVVLATNAYTGLLGWFGDRFVPLHAHAVATERRAPEEWEALGWSPGFAGFSDDLDRVAFGGMTTRGELVFGGGSNAAYDYSFGSGTAFRGSPERASEAIRARLVRYLPAAERVGIARSWTGPVALTMNRVCTMGVTGAHRNVYYALGYSGHGVVLANLAGRVLCDAYSGDDERWRGLPFYQNHPHYIPPEPLRWVGYQAYTRLTGRSPRKS